MVWYICFSYTVRKIKTILQSFYCLIPLYGYTAFCSFTLNNVSQCIPFPIITLNIKGFPKPLSKKSQLCKIRNFPLQHEDHGLEELAWCKGSSLGWNLTYGSNSPLQPQPPKTATQTYDCSSSGIHPPTPVLSSKHPQRALISLHISGRWWGEVGLKLGPYINSLAWR